MKTSRRKTLTPWLFGAIISTGMFLFLWIFGDMQFTGNDDTLILRTFMGYSGGTIPTFHIYLNALLTYPLHWLGTALPTVPWFSWMQIAFLWLSCTVICKGMIQCFRNHQKSIWFGAFVSIVFTLTFVLHYASAITYTVTAAMLGAAAVVQIMSIDYKHANDRQILRGILLSLLLVVLGYSLRQMTAMPTLAFCGIAFLYNCVEYFGFGKKAKRAMKPMLITLLIVAVVMGSLVGLREWEIRATGMDEHLRWQKARIEVMDYYTVSNLSSELLEEIGWTDLQRQLIGNHWYFLDSNIDAEAFEKVASFQKSKQADKGLMEKLASAKTVISAFRFNEPVVMRSLYLIPFLMLCCAIGLVLQRKNTLWRWLALLLSGIFVCIMLLYLGIEGRFILRGMLTPVLPFTALVFCLLGACLPKGDGIGKFLNSLFAIGCVALTAFYLVVAAPQILKAPVDEEDLASVLNPYQSLDDYALYEPETLFVYDSTLLSDTRMFPNTDDGVPHNIVFWGGWGCRTPEYMDLLASFGIDGNDTDATLLLQENVRLVRGVIDPGPDLMCSYLQELTGEYVDYYPESEYDGIYIMEFYQ